MRQHAKKMDSGLQMVPASFSAASTSNWVMVGASVEVPGRPAEARYFLVPRSDFAIVDDWYTMGLRGSGNRGIHIPNAFIPERRSITLQSITAGRAPAP